MAFLEIVLEWKNFFLNVEIVLYINSDILYIYYAHLIGYSSGINKVNLAYRMCRINYK